MAKKGTERKLRAILAADMAGYSRLMGADEEGVIARHKRHHKQLIDPRISKHRGRIVKTTGDGLLAEFESAVDAVKCAAEIQRAMAKREARVPDDQRIAYRIGVNLGDIVIDGDDIFGDGVNIAARLEGLAEPGGICISRNVFDQVQNKVKLGYQDLGPQKVKNIAQPVPAYKVLLDPGDAGKLVAPRRTVKPLAMGLAAAVLIVVAAGLAWWRPWALDVEPAALAKMAFPLPKKPSIAVLPFTNMSGNKDQDYFAHGMAEDIITDLSKLSALFVVARKSSFRYKGKSVEVKQVGRELGVKYLLEGSVRRAGDRVRINAQLIDTETGGQVWAERYDGNLADVFALQDKITGRIIKALSIKLGAGEKAQLADRGTNNFEAHDAFLKGHSYAREFTSEGFAKAIAWYERALKLDPKYSRASDAIKQLRFIREESGLR